MDRPVSTGTKPDDERHYSRIELVDGEIASARVITRISLDASLEGVAKETYGAISGRGLPCSNVYVAGRLISVGLGMPKEDVARWRTIQPDRLVFPASIVRGLQSLGFRDPGKLFRWTAGLLEPGSALFNNIEHDRARLYLIDDNVKTGLRAVPEDKGADVSGLSVSVDMSYLGGKMKAGASPEEAFRKITKRAAKSQAVVRTILELSPCFIVSPNLAPDVVPFCDHLAFAMLDNLLLAER